MGEKDAFHVIRANSSTCLRTRLNKQFASFTITSLTVVVLHLIFINQLSVMFVVFFFFYVFCFSVNELKVKVACLIHRQLNNRVMSGQGKASLQDSTLSVQHETESGDDDSPSEELDHTNTSLAEIASRLANVGDDFDRHYARPAYEAGDEMFIQNVVHQYLILLLELYRVFWQHL